MSAPEGARGETHAAGEPERPTLSGESARRYELGRCVGRGGMGVVWAARDREGREVAIKVVRFERPMASVARLRREATAMRRVLHPSVCAVEDLVDLEDGSIGLVMELLEGETLQERLGRDGSLEPSAAARLLAPAIEAVRAAHANGVVHRDLKPSNIFLPSAGGVRVLDFGIAKILTTGSDSSEGDDLTTSNTLLGSPAYMAPEQIFGEPDLDERADVWALGLVLYRTLSGVLPTDPQGEGVGKVLKLILKEPIRPLREVAPAIPVELASTIDAMLVRERENRSPELGAILATLRACDPDASIPAVEATADEGPPGVERLPPPVDEEELPALPVQPRRGWMLAGAIAAAAVMGLVFTWGPASTPPLDAGPARGAQAAGARATPASLGPQLDRGPETSAPLPSAAVPPPIFVAPSRASSSTLPARASRQTPASPAHAATSSPVATPPPPPPPRPAARDPLEDAR